MNQSPRWPFSAGDCPGPVVTLLGAGGARSALCIWLPPGGRIAVGAWIDSDGSRPFTGVWRARPPPRGQEGPIKPG